MKRINNLFDKICDLENIKLAHKNAKRGKKSKYGPGYTDEIKEVNKDVIGHCIKIQTMLLNKTFINSEYFIFKTTDTEKVRTVYQLPYFPDRIIHHAIMQILGPIWKRSFITDTYQSIKGRGVHKAAHKVENVIRTSKKELYCLKVDVEKFYPSVDNNILKNMLRKKIKCKDTLWLLDTIINSIKGLPIGNYLSQHLGNLYLSYLDHDMKEKYRVKHYFRYCDDIVILHSNKKYLHYLRNVMSEYMSVELNLKMKNNYQVFPIESRGLDFLGYRFFTKYTLVRKRIVKRFKFAIIEKSESINFKSVLSSYAGWFKLANGFNITKGLLLPIKRIKGIK